MYFQFSHETIYHLRTEMRQEFRQHSKLCFHLCLLFCEKETQSLNILLYEEIMSEISFSLLLPLKLLKVTFTVVTPSFWRDRTVLSTLFAILSASFGCISLWSSDYIYWYRNDSKFSDREVYSNSADPGSTRFAIPSASFGSLHKGKSTLFTF